MDDECRAHKALVLLKARDKKIALLERRIFQLENSDSRMQTVYLQQPSGTSSIELSDKEGWVRRYQTNEVSSVQDNKSKDNTTSKNLFQESRTSLSKKKNRPILNANLSQSVPSLQLPTSSASNSTEKDVCSTPATLFTKHCSNRLKTSMQSFEPSSNSESPDFNRELSHFAALKIFENPSENLESNNPIFDCNYLEYLLTNDPPSKVLKEIEGCVTAKQGNFISKNFTFYFEM